MTRLPHTATEASRSTTPSDPLASSASKLQRQTVSRLGSRAHGDVPIARGLLTPDDAPAAASTAGAARSTRADAVREEVVIAHREQAADPRRSAIGAAPLAGRRRVALVGHERRAQRRPGGRLHLRLRRLRRLHLRRG